MNNRIDPIVLVVAADQTDRVKSALAQEQSSHNASCRYGRDKRSVPSAMPLGITLPVRDALIRPIHREFIRKCPPPA